MTADLETKTTGTDLDATPRPVSLKDGNSRSDRFLAAPGFAVRRTVRRPELRKIVPLADTTIYEMEQRGEFPRRFYLTPRCVVWDLAEVERWIEERQRASKADAVRRAPAPDVRKRKSRPVRQ
jgi:prophage regulatory protein